MKLEILIVIALLVLPAAADPQKTKYIGYRHKGVVSEESLPNGVKSLGGGLLANASYGVSRFSKDGQQMLWLEKITDRDDLGVPSWVVKDVLFTGAARKNQELFFSYSSPCRQHGRRNLNLIVRAELRPAQKTYKILDAWQVSAAREKFGKISTQGIDCEYVAP